MDIPHFTTLPFNKDRPWLICGKGPSLSNWKDEYKDKFNVLCINHSILHTGYADVLHIVDVEFFVELIDTNYKYMVTPWTPNKNFTPTNNNKHITSYFILKPIVDERRLYSYDWILDDHIQYPDTERVFSQLSSGQSIFHMMGILNQKNIYTIGIDGGPSTHRHPDMVRYGNGADYQRSLDTIHQFCKRYQMTWIKL